jgi:hypothetical protein
MQSIGYVTLFALANVLGGSFFQDRTISAVQKGDPMNVSRITVDHVQFIADKPID